MSEHDEMDPEELALEDLELEDLDEDVALLVADEPDAEFRVRSEEHEVVELDDEALHDL